MTSTKVFELVRSGRDGSAVEGTRLLSRGPRLHSQHPSGTSRPSIIQFQGINCPLLIFMGTAWCPDIHAGKKKTINIRIMCKWIVQNILKVNGQRNKTQRQMHFHCLRVLAVRLILLATVTEVNWGCLQVAQELTTTPSLSPVPRETANLSDDDLILA